MTDKNQLIRQIIKDGETVYGQELVNIKQTSGVQSIGGDLWIREHFWKNHPNLKDHVKRHLMKSEYIDNYNSIIIRKLIQRDQIDLASAVNTAAKSAIRGPQTNVR